MPATVLLAGTCDHLILTAPNQLGYAREPRDYAYRPSVRIALAGRSRYLVEPHVKDGKGGLRDLNTLFWIAKYVYRLREAAGAGVFSVPKISCSAVARNFSGGCAAICIF